MPYSYGGGGFGQRPGMQPQSPIRQQFPGASQSQTPAYGTPRTADPYGPSPAIAALLQRRALRSQRNRMRQGQVLGQLAGLDPMQQRQQMADIGRESTGQLSDFLNEGQFQEVMGNRDYGRRVADQERGFGFQREMFERERKARGGWKGMLGGLIGQGVGAFTGGFAGGYGKRFAGQGTPYSGSPWSEEEYPRG